MKLIKNEKGAGLIMAIFVIVILGIFGTLISRFTIIGATESIEQYLWAQALYSAESAAQLRILSHDSSNGLTFPYTIEEFTIPEPAAVDDTFLPDKIRVQPSTLKVEATRVNVSRKIEVKYML